MSTLAELKDNLDKALKEHTQLESENRRLETKKNAAKEELAKLQSEIEALKDTKKNLNAEIQEARAAKIAEIEKRDSESEKLQQYLAGEKKAVNQLKAKLEDSAKAYEKMNAELATKDKDLKLKVSKIEKFIEDWNK